MTATINSLESVNYDLDNESARTYPFDILIDSPTELDTVQADKTTATENQISHEEQTPGSDVYARMKAELAVTGFQCINRDTLEPLDNQPPEILYSGATSTTGNTFRRAL